MIENIQDNKGGKGSKLELYNDNVANSIFKSIKNEFQYQSENVLLDIEELEDEGNIYSLLSPGMKLVDICKSYCIQNSILGTEEKNIEGLYFLIANIKNNNTSQLECFEDGVIIPEEYRGGNVALNMYKVMIEFCKKQGVKRINSDTELSKGGNSIYEKIIQEGYSTTKNENCGRSEDYKLKSYDSYPIYIIDL